MEKNFIRQIDFFLLDKFFQPMADLLSDMLSVTPWSFGRNLQLGSLLFQAVASIVPFIINPAFVSGSFEDSLGSPLSLLLSIVLFIFLQRYSVLIRPNMINPLREFFWGGRILSVGFFLYSLWDNYRKGMFFELSTYLNNLSDILFILAIYFMSCTPKPPKERHSQKFSFGERGL